MRIHTPQDGQISQGVRPLHVIGTGGATATQTQHFAYDELTVDGGGGGGIKFDTDPQTGDWLWIEVLNYPSNVGFTPVDSLDSAFGLRAVDGGIQFQAGPDDHSDVINSFFRVDVQGGGNFGVKFNVLDDPNSGFKVVVGGATSSSGILLHLTDGGFGSIKFQTDGSNAGGIKLVDFGSGGGGISITAAGSGGELNIVAESGANLNITQESATGGLNIFNNAGKGIIVAASVFSNIFYPGSSARPVVIISDGEGTNTETVAIGVMAGDIFSVFEYADAGGGATVVTAEYMTVSSAGVGMTTLPTSAPGTTGKLWNNSGVVHIT